MPGLGVCRTSIFPRAAAEPCPARPPPSSISALPATRTHMSEASRPWARHRFTAQPGSCVSCSSTQPVRASGVPWAPSTLCSVSVTSRGPGDHTMGVLPGHMFVGLRAQPGAIHVPTERTQETCAGDQTPHCAASHTPAVYTGVLWFFSFCCPGFLEKQVRPKAHLRPRSCQEAARTCCSVLPAPTTAFIRAARLASSGSSPATRCPSDQARPGRVPWSQGPESETPITCGPRPWRGRVKGSTPEPGGLSPEPTQTTWRACELGLGSK